MPDWGVSTVRSTNSYACSRTAARRTSTMWSLAASGRNRSNVWPYAGVNAFGKERNAELGMHPTVKPVALVADAILDCSKRNAIVLDAFAGSGTTLIAAERTGRKGYGIEIDPHRCDTILRRFRSLYGLKAVHTPSNKTLEDLETGPRKGTIWLAGQ
jgi:DNA modification methylase